MRGAACVGTHAFPSTVHRRGACRAQTYNMQVLNASAGSVAVSAVMYWQALGANAGSSSVALILQARLLRQARFCLGLGVSLNPKPGLRSRQYTADFAWHRQVLHLAFLDVCRMTSAMRAARSH